MRPRRDEFTPRRWRPNGHLGDSRAMLGSFRRGLAGAEASFSLGIFECYFSLPCTSAEYMGRWARVRRSALEVQPSQACKPPTTNWSHAVPFHPVIARFPAVNRDHTSASRCLDLNRSVVAAQSTVVQPSAALSSHTKTATAPLKLRCDDRDWCFYY